jgi:DNA-binding GntR family transcriptional regulator
VQVSSKSAGKVEFAYEKLKLLVVTNQLRPNEHIQITGMADRLAVGVTPLREALIRLAAEDLIVLHPRRGFFAKVVTIGQVRELYHVAVSLLRSSVRSGAGGFDDQRVTPQVTYIRSSATSDAQISACAQAVESLYEEMTMMSRNAEMLKIIRNFNNRTHAVRMIRVELFDGAESTIDYVGSLATLLKAEQREHALAKLERRFETTLAELPRLIKEVTSRAFSGRWSDYPLESCGRSREQWHDASTTRHGPLTVQLRHPSSDDGKGAHQSGVR